MYQFPSIPHYYKTDDCQIVADNMYHSHHVLHAHGLNFHANARRRNISSS
jgi:hypothetical protein